MSGLIPHHLKSRIEFNASSQLQKLASFNSQSRVSTSMNQQSIYPGHASQLKKDDSAFESQPKMQNYSGAMATFSNSQLPYFANHEPSSYQQYSNYYESSSNTSSSLSIPEIFSDHDKNLIWPGKDIFDHINDVPFSSNNGQANKNYMSKEWSDYATMVPPSLKTHLMKSNLTGSAQFSSDSLQSLQNKFSSMNPAVSPQGSSASSLDSCLDNNSSIGISHNEPLQLSLDASSPISPRSSQEFNTIPESSPNYYMESDNAKPEIKEKNKTLSKEGKKERKTPYSRETSNKEYKLVRRKSALRKQHRVSSSQSEYHGFGFKKTPNIHILDSFSEFKRKSKDTVEFDIRKINFERVYDKIKDSKYFDHNPNLVEQSVNREAVRESIRIKSKAPIKDHTKKISAEVISKGVEHIIHECYVDLQKQEYESREKLEIEEKCLNFREITALGMVIPRDKIVLNEKLYHVYEDGSFLEFKAPERKKRTKQPPTTHAMVKEIYKERYFIDNSSGEFCAPPSAFMPPPSTNKQQYKLKAKHALKMIGRKSAKDYPVERFVVKSTTSKYHPYARTHTASSNKEPSLTNYQQPNDIQPKDSALINGTVHEVFYDFCSKSIQEFSKQFKEAVKERKPELDNIFEQEKRSYQQKLKMDKHQQVGMEIEMKDSEFYITSHLPTQNNSIWGGCF